VHTATVGTGNWPIKGDDKRAVNSFEAIITQVDPCLRSMSDANVLHMHAKRPRSYYGARYSHYMRHPLHAATDALQDDV
jgi:hypothetical protein